MLGKAKRARQISKINMLVLENPKYVRMLYGK